MRFIALLRGINVGGHRKVEMKRLRRLFETLGCTDVSTYLNSGNVIFELDNTMPSLNLYFQDEISREFGFGVPALIKSEKEIRFIAQAIPGEWTNDISQRTDIAFLFPEIDKELTIDDLPVKSEFMEIRYVKGAIFWNIDRRNYNKSRLSKLASHDIYKMMTIRNVNTLRYLAKW